MAMGTQGAREKQEDLFYASEQAEAPGHPFYQQLNGALEEAKFDSFCEQRCRRFYHSKLGRPSLAPGVYFRLLLIGFFEGIGSERGTGVAGGRLFESAAISKVRTERSDSGSRDDFAHPAISGRSGASGGVHVRAHRSGAARHAEGQDHRHRCDHAGSQRSECDPSCGAIPAKITDMPVASMPEGELVYDWEPRSLVLATLLVKSSFPNLAAPPA